MGVWRCYGDATEMHHRVVYEEIVIEDVRAHEFKQRVKAATLALGLCTSTTPLLIKHNGECMRSAMMLLRDISEVRPQQRRARRVTILIH